MPIKVLYSCFNCSNDFEVDLKNDKKIYNLCNECNNSFNICDKKIIASGNPYNWGSGFVENVVGIASNASLATKVVFVKPLHDLYHINLNDINQKPGFINWLVCKPSEVRLITDKEEQEILQLRQDACSEILESFLQLEINDFLMKDYSGEKSNLSAAFKKIDINKDNINLETVKHYKYSYQDKQYLIMSFNNESITYYTVSIVMFDYWMNCNWLGYRMYKNSNSNKFKCII